jgi:hypothetical protein
MNYSVFLSAAAIALYTPCNLEAAAECRFRDAVAQVETGMDPTAIGDNGRAFGMYQMHQAAWDDALKYAKNKRALAYPISQWRNRIVQHIMASHYLDLCADRMRSRGVKNPTPQQVYLCFAIGFKGFEEIGFNPARAPEAKRDAAERVFNIFTK